MNCPHWHLVILAMTVEFALEFTGGRMPFDDNNKIYFPIIVLWLFSFNHLHLARMLSFPHDSRRDLHCVGDHERWERDWIAGFLFIQAEIANKITGEMCPNGECLSQYRLIPWSPNPPICWRRGPPTKQCENTNKDASILSSSNIFFHLVRRDCFPFAAIH